MSTYGRYSMASATHTLYDSYIKAIRWATERLEKSGVVGFITANSFIDKKSTDGMRKVLVDDFNHLYIINLRGGVRGKSKKIAKSEGGNVFDIMTGVAISILVKDGSDVHEIHYHEMEDGLNRQEKLDWLSKNETALNVKLQLIIPDEHNDWINQRDDSYQLYDSMSGSVFYSKFIGIQTKRDNWVYSFSDSLAYRNTSNLINNFNNQINMTNMNTNGQEIKWSDDLKRRMNKHLRLSDPDEKNLRLVQYRPFTKKWLYFQDEVIARPGRGTEYFEIDNVTINLNGTSARKEFGVSLSCLVPDANMMDAGTQSFPLKFSDGSYNVQSFRNMTEEETFYYVFALLQSGEFQQKYRNDLQKDLPNIPMAKEREKYIEIGRKLVELATRYDSQQSWPGVTVSDSSNGKNMAVKKMKHPKIRNAQGKLVPDNTKIIFNDNVTVSGIPERAYKYVVNGKSGISWVIDQYQIKKDKKSGIIDDPNNFSEDPKYILKLLLSVITVSMRTLELIDELPEFEVEE